jgi:zinc resistance-associated protein
MNKLAIGIGILLAIGLVAIPVMDWGPHMGSWGGNHMMGYWGNGPNYGRDAGNLTADQQSKLAALDRKFYEETRELRDQIWTKSGELDATLNSTTPDLEKAKALQKEISELRATLDDKRFNYELEVRKIIPDQQYGYGYGHMMGNYGYGMGYGMGYGHGGYCWN